ncbi:MAG: noncanonical pyrimidine nucleotidase, YjjG family [Herbinix sp.]|jgi:2-haloacid dehalogenase|nr:noncanonical pyrimidine nucleotidase, YjjG family [Herbinix sp.]
MKNFKTILLDADNTLFDFTACEKEALKQTFVKYDYPLNEEIASSYERINVNLWRQYELGQMDRNTVIYSRFGLLFKEIGIEDDGIKFEDDYQELLGMQHFFLENALEVVEYLYKKYNLYIVTNGVTTTQLRRLKDSGLDQYMKQIFVSEETGYQKPMKEYFDYCFHRIADFDPTSAMIIGDSLSSDIKGGNNAGISTCWLNPSKLEKPSDIKVDYEIQSLKELYELL